jgi:hypothetical protein
MKNNTINTIIIILICILLSSCNSSIKAPQISNTKSSANQLASSNTASIPSPSGTQKPEAAPKGDAQIPLELQIKVFGQYPFNYYFDNNEFNEFNKFKNGLQIEGFANQDWIEDLNLWRSEGKTIKRIRVVPYNITEYFKYELEWCYPRNIDAGELITFIPEKLYLAISEKFKIGQDFWIFDNEMVILLDYNEKYEYMDCSQIIDDKVWEYIKFVYALSEHALNFPEFLKSTAY